MHQFFGYIRVSTAKQGELGVSLQQQRDAIERHAQRHGLEIIRWFEEQETAAKRGRPLFNLMIRLLRRGAANGVVIHKIDRGARNLRDWSDLGELIDQGVDVRFADESLDLHSRGGRLSADIQAVVAADYVRNLREETKKGFYGRLKQGFFPMPAPIGYLDSGAAKPKLIDPVGGPLIRTAFELYASGRFNQRSLADKLYQMGLRTRTGNRLNKNRLSEVLNNTFYIGLITIKKTGETYQGVHEPLISHKLFERVQKILRGKTHSRTFKNELLYRRRLKCKSCGYSLVGEVQKAHVYYRCQTKNCPTTCIREEKVESEVLRQLSLLQLSPIERAYLKQEVARLSDVDQDNREKVGIATQLRISQIDDRLNRLTDAYIDQVVDKNVYAQRKKALLLERKGIEESLEAWAEGKQETLAEFLERADTAYFLYKTGNTDQKRNLLESLTSNRTVDQKTPVVTLRFPFDHVANRHRSAIGGPRRDIHRTCNHLLNKLVQLVHNKDSELVVQPGLPSPEVELPESGPAPKLPAWMKKKFQSGIYIPGRRTSSTENLKKTSDDTLPSFGESMSA